MTTVVGRILTYLSDGKGRTLDEISAALNMGRVQVKSHIGKMRADGLAETRVPSRHNMAAVYGIAPRGHLYKPRIRKNPVDYDEIEVWRLPDAATIERMVRKTQRTAPRSVFDLARQP